MKNDNPASKAEQKSITVKVEFRDPVEGKAPSARVYLFDRTGRLVSSKLADGKPLTFHVDAGSRSQFRVGPDLLKDNQAPADLAAQLDRAKAFGQDYIPAIHGDRLTIAIHQVYWLCWIFPTCINVH